MTNSTTSAAASTHCSIERFGGVDVLRVSRTPELPQPRRGQVRVCVEAASVQFTDTVIRRGKYPDAGKLPITLGYDLVGRVDAVGADCIGWKVGDRVADLTKVGAYSTHVLLAARNLVRVPVALDAAEATALILSGVTAYQMMFRHVALEPGQSVLVQGGHGAVGWFAIQLALRSGARVWTTAQPAHHEVLRQLGAQPVDYRDPDYPARVRAESGGGVELVFDGQGAKLFRDSFRCLKRCGRLVTIGASDAVTRGGGMTLSVVAALLRNLRPFAPRSSFYSITSMRKAHPDWFRADLATLFEKLEHGELRVRIARRITFAEIADAHRELERGGVSGKIVLLPTQPYPQLS